MVTAPVLTWEEADPGWSRTQARRELHQEFDRWMDEAEEGMKEEPTSLDALTKAVFASICLNLRPLTHTQGSIT